MKFLLYCTFLALLLNACSANPAADDNDADEILELRLLSVHELPIIDPSGLSFTADRSALWTVSDERGGNIYKISFTGEVLDVIGYEGDDLEGITVRVSTNTLFVVEERLRQVIELDTNGTVLRSATLNIPANAENDGLEGITIDEAAGVLYIVNEKNPRLFLVVDIETLEVLSQTPINFSGIYLMRDLSGIYFEEKAQELWFLSDDSARIVVSDLDLNPLRVYETEMPQGEGIAVDVDGRKIYIVDDLENSLYVFGY